MKLDLGTVSHDDDPREFDRSLSEKCGLKVFHDFPGNGLKPWTIFPGFVNSRACWKARGKL